MVGLTGLIGLGLGLRVSGFIGGRSIELEKARNSRFRPLKSPYRP